MSKVYVHGNNITSSLGLNSQENFSMLVSNTSGIRYHNTGDIYGEIPLSKIDKDKFENRTRHEKIPDDFSFFEKTMLWSAKDSISQSNIDVSSDKTIFIISSTKGNIEFLEAEHQIQDFRLWHSARKISSYFNNPNTPVVVSNACISGVLTLNTAALLLREGVYKNAVVIGADVISEFIIAGFMSFHSLSSNPCRPFDKNRDGLTLGEAAGSIVLSSLHKSEFEILGGASSNDANHISGPSRTGEGLYLAIASAIKNSGITAKHINFISAHGTATLYNDEMEALSLHRNKLEEVFTNSFKGYWGHTLGAAGIIETIATLKSMENNYMIRSLGYDENGVSKNLNILDENQNMEINFALKTAAGFGGANAAIILKNATL